MPLGTGWARQRGRGMLGTRAKRKNPLWEGVCMARQVGVEPTTVRLTVGCSATELLPNTCGGPFPAREG